jgi:hypothetical protein
VPDFFNGLLAGWNVARAIAVLPVKSDVGAYWVQLVLQSPLVRSRIDSRLNTTVQATLNLGDVAKLPIRVRNVLEEDQAERGTSCRRQGATRPRQMPMP